LYDASHPPDHRLGSLANLDMALIKDASEGLRAIRKSIYAACMCPSLASSQKDPYDANFLTYFMKTITLVFAFDKLEMLAYLDGSGLVRKGRCEELSLGDGGFATDKFITSLLGHSQNSIVDGLDYLRQVPISNQIYVVCG
jgi:hypothetical protein